MLVRQQTSKKIILIFMNIIEETFLPFDYEDTFESKLV